MQSAQHQLLGAEVSYYTAKVRAYLRWKQIPFRELAATREIYRELRAASRVGVDQLLDKTGGRALLATAIPRRLERTHNQLRFAR